jgi:hypothetical protein
MPMSRTSGRVGAPKAMGDASLAGDARLGSGSSQVWSRSLVALLACITAVGFATLACIAPLAAASVGRDENLARVATDVPTGADTHPSRAFGPLWRHNRPILTTEPASLITQTSATLNGTVNPNLSAVSSCEFEYGTSPTLEEGVTKVPCGSLPGSGESSEPVSAPVSNLTANTPYYFRLDAANAKGPRKGNIETFTTLPNAPSVVTGAASAPTQTSVTLNGTVDPNGGEVKSCLFEFGTSATYGSSVPCSTSPGAGETPVTVSADLGSLAANKTYHFRISATNAGGESVGGDQTFETSPNPEVILVPPATSNQVGTPFSETATVKEGGAPLVGVVVRFTVTGANPQSGMVTTNEAGQATFSYMGQHAGTDHIVASFVDKAGMSEISNEVIKTWTETASSGGGGAGSSTSGAATSGGVATGGAPSPVGGVLSFKTLPPPVLGKTVNAEPVSGVVFVKLPNGARESLASPWDAAFVSLSRGLGFVPLAEPRQIPVGSTFEGTHGVVKLTTATVAAAKFQFGDFGAGIFTLLQNRKQRGLTELRIVDSRNRPRVCATIGKRASVASRHLSSTALGRLSSNDHGKFTTRGQYSAATVRGTEYTVTNECAGTLTQVRRGEVSVRDFVRRKTIILHAGQHYLAKAP